MTATKLSLALESYVVVPSCKGGRQLTVKNFKHLYSSIWSNQIFYRGCRHTGPNYVLYSELTLLLQWVGHFSFILAMVFVSSPQNAEFLGKSRLCRSFWLWVPLIYVIRTRQSNTISSYHAAK